MMMSDTNQPDQPAEWIASAEAVRTLMTGYSPATSAALDKFITADPGMMKLKDAVRRLARVQDTVLITGPSGHGKELIARALHWRPEKPFVPVNCAAIPSTLLASTLFGYLKGTFTGANEDRDGLFIKAADGTIFLDEIGDMPADQQPALLRVLQEREVHKLGSILAEPVRCRIIAATNNTANIRTDLLGRLAELELIITPLHTRPVDIDMLRIHYNINPATVLDEDKLAAYGVRYIQAVAKRQQYGID